MRKAFLVSLKTLECSGFFIQQISRFHNNNSGHQATGDNSMDDLLQSQLAELNKQMLNYKMAISNGLTGIIDPNGMISHAFQIANQQAPRIDPSVQNCNPAAQDAEYVEIESSAKKEDVKTIRGARGKRGKRGPRGEQGPPGKSFYGNTYTIPAKLISANYTASSDDCYIGVNSTESITIVLPENPEDGKMITFKLEMTPPLNGKKVTLKAVGGAMIESDFTMDLKYPYESATLLYRGSDWFVLNNYR